VAALREINKSIDFALGYLRRPVRALTIAKVRQR
jgi:hypothetical protein